jgi:hypothetical protein
MKLFATKRPRVCLTLTLLLSATAVAHQTAKKETAAHVAGESKLVAAVQWRVTGKQGHLRCEVSQQTSAAKDDSLTRVLAIYREDEGKLAKVFTFGTPDSLLNVYPLGDYNARLFTTWVGGSAYHVRVFAFVDGQVKKVLEKGTKVAPEFLYDDQGQESVLITAPVMENGKWTSVNGTTTVFKWNGRSYDKLGTVPWVERLQCRSKESCASSK